MGGQHVVVIGAGIVGAAAAHELINAGKRVTIVEPDEPGGPQAASYGNGAWISPGSVIPMSSPGLWKKVPGYLLDPLGPLTIRWASLPWLADWLVRFVRAGSTVAKIEAVSRALAPLVIDAPARHERLARAVGAGDLIKREGLLYVYPSRSAFEAEALSWRLRKDAGNSWRELDAAGLRALEPAVGPQYQFGVVLTGGAHCIDPGAYVAAIVADAVKRGATRIAARATGFEVRDGKLWAVSTDKGAIDCDKVIVAAGIGSGALATAAGDHVPLVSERGYHVVVSSPEVGPKIPIMPSDGKMANTMTRAGLRAAGQVELARVDAAPNWRRADILLKHLLASYPGLPRDVSPDRIKRWLGHRPSTPDGLPVVGPAWVSDDIVYAFGHGHIGLAAGPATAELAVAIATGARCTIESAPYAADRF